MTKREKAVEAGREVRQIQREYLREVAGEMKTALEAFIKSNGDDVVEQARKALEKARRLGL